MCVSAKPMNHSVQTHEPDAASKSIRTHDIAYLCAESVYIYIYLTEASPGKAVKSREQSVHKQELKMGFTVNCRVVAW